MIKHVKFVSIPTRDQDRALRFWTEQVGFKLLTDQPMGDGQRWLELSIPGAQTRIALFNQRDQDDRIGTAFNGAFATDDVTYTYEKMKAKGVVFDVEPTKQPWGTFAIFRDPDGNTFVLSST
jgi:predicted enzyme related to lactoylglutathione lyase